MIDENNENKLLQFRTKAELEIGFAAYQMASQPGLDKAVAMLTAQSATKYVPHIFSGGWVIPGFGYSIERIGQHITLAEAGTPFGVQ